MSPSAQANDMCGRGFCSENMKLVRQSQGLLRLCNAYSLHPYPKSQEQFPNDTDLQGNGYQGLP